METLTIYDVFKILRAIYHMYWPAVSISAREGLPVTNK